MDKLVIFIVFFILLGKRHLYSILSLFGLSRQALMYYYLRFAVFFIEIFLIAKNSIFCQGCSKWLGQIIQFEFKTNSFYIRSKRWRCRTVWGVSRPRNRIVDRISMKARRNRPSQLIQPGIKLRFDEEHFLQNLQNKQNNTEIEIIPSF